MTPLNIQRTKLIQAIELKGKDVIDIFFSLMSMRLANVFAKKFLCECTTAFVIPVDPDVYVCHTKWIIEIGQFRTTKFFYEIAVVNVDDVVERL